KNGSRRGARVPAEGRGGGIPDRAAERADAVEGRGGAARGRWLALRAEMGRVPRHRVPRPRPCLPSEPRPETPRSLLPRAPTGLPGQPSRALRRRRGDRDRGRARARLRGAADAPAPGGLAGGEARRGDAGLLRRLRSPRGGRRRSSRSAALRPLRKNALGAHPWREWAGALEGGTRMPGASSRWSQGKDLSWEPLRIERVCEVKYDHLQGARFRHAAAFMRWRPDKRPAECRYDQ